MSRNIFAVLLFAAMLTTLAALAGCEEEQARSAPQAAAQPAAKPALRVGVVTISPQCVFITTELAGRTSPYLIAEVRPQVGGIIEKRLFEEGADIEAGQLLYKIDSARYQAAVDSARATLERAKANAEPLRLKAERYDRLVKDGAISTQDYDDAMAAYQQARAEIGVAQAELKTARINLEYTDISSPIAGRIGKSEVTAGALVTANQATALAKVQQLDPMYVDMTQSSRELLRMRRDLESGRITRPGGGPVPVSLILEDGSTYEHQGELEFSDVTVEQSTGEVTVRAVFPNPDVVLLPGMYVRALVREGQCDGAILVPQPAVLRDPTGATIVYVVDDNETVQTRPVMVDRAHEADWLISSGLKAGDRVVLEGLQKIRPGMKVSAVPVAKGAANPAAAD